MSPMNTGMIMADDAEDEEMIAVSSPIFKSTPVNSKSRSGSFESASPSPSTVLGNSPPPIPERQVLLQQHSYTGHEEDMNDENMVGSVGVAPSGRPFLATRHLSIEDRGSPQQQRQWTNHPAIRNHFHATPPSAELLFPSSSENAATSSPPRRDENNEEQQQQRQPPPEEEETAEERARREEEESIALAQMLMAEEAMASHRMSADFLRMNSEQFSAEDFAALQDALREEEEPDYDETEVSGEDTEDMSYDALLRLGERMGDVKTDRWTMIANKEIAKLETFAYDPEKTNDNNQTEGDSRPMDIDDSEIKCLVCQCAYEKGDELRRLPCGHCFHKDCVDQWLQTKDICAYCRQSIVPEKKKEE